MTFAILVGLAGCKKEDAPSAYFNLTGSSSLHFEYGQEKKVEFTTREVQKVAVSTVPNGWECVKSGNAFVITAPSSAEGDSKKSETIKVIATTNSGGEISNSITVEVKVAEKIEAPANSFIVTAPGQRYKFDATRRGDGTSQGATPADAKLVWVTAKNAVGHVSLEDGNLYFATEDAEQLTEANALVAALDKDGEIIWSWHIWCTKDDPRLNADELEGIKVMTRNLGAFRSELTTESTAADTLASYGLYYQWGRKDPFAGPDSWKSSTQHRLFNNAGKDLVISYEATTSKIGTIDYATANPLTFITGIKDSEWDWLFTKRDNTLWGNANSGSGVTDAKGTKSAYDPCPAGWMVAPPKIWKSFTKDGAATSVKEDFNVENKVVTAKWNGWIFTDNAGGGEATAIYYPAAGRRSFGIAKDKGNFTNITDPGFGEPGQPVGFYWSNSNSSSVNGAFLSFTTAFINPDSSQPVKEDPKEEDDPAYGARAGGFPVRCVAE